MSQSRLLSTADGGPASPPHSNFWEWLSLGKPHQASNLALAVHHQSPGHLSNLFAASTSSSTSPSRPVGFRCSFGQLGDAVEKLATILYNRGLREGDVVASFIGNDRAVEWALLLWTSWRIGAVFAPVEPGLLARKTALREVRELLDPKVVVLNDGMDTKSWMEVDVPGHDRIIRLVCGGNIESGGEKWSLLPHMDGSCNGLSSPPPSVSRPTQLALIVFTSGTTSTPKGCRLTFANIHAEIEGFQTFAHSSWVSGVKFLATTSLFRPLCYLGSLNSWTVGGSVIFADSAFDPMTVIEMLKAERATHLMMVPTQLRALVNASVRQQTSLEHELLFVTPGGNMPDPELVSDARQALKPRLIVPHWGMTEGAPLFGFCVTNNTWASLPRLKSGDTGIGCALPGTKMRICSATDSSPMPVPRGIRGELHVSSPARIHSYLGDVSSSSFHEDPQGRWFLDSRHYGMLVAAIKCEYKVLQTHLDSLGLCTSAN